MDFKAQLVRGLHTMAEMRDVIKDTHGNLSVREDDLVAIKPSGVPYNVIEVDQVYVCDVLGKHGGGPLKPSVDLPHHLALYQNHPWIKAICHTHSPYVVGYAIANEDIRVTCTEHADYFGHEIRITGGNPDLDSWGKELWIEEGEKAVILRQHGALTFGRDAEEAVRLAAALEQIAQKNFIASMISGTVARPSSMRASDIQKWHRRYQESYGQR